jgi:hypothetical protein
MATPHDSRHCGANKRQGEGTCTRPAGWGTDHVGYGPCKLHGGCSPSVDGIVIEAQVRELFGKIAPKVGPVENPLAAYASFAGRVMAWMQLLDSLLDDVRAVGYESEYAGVQINAAVQLYERALDRCNRVLSDFARLKIDERLAAITVEQKRMVIRAIEAALDEAGLDGEARENAKRAAGRHLRAA